MNFHLKPDMYVTFPKVQLAAFKDNTMPRQDWSRYDEPTYLRKQRALNGERKPISIRKAG